MRSLATPSATPGVNLPAVIKWVSCAVLWLALIPAEGALAADPSTSIGEQRAGFLWSKTVRGDFEEIVETIKSAAARKNFPTNKVRNYKKSFDKRLEQTGGRKFPYAQYKILEICNVMLAIESLRLDPRMGIFMPCRVVVYARPGSDEVTLMTVNPRFMPATLKNPALDAIAVRVEAVILEIFAALDF